MSRRIKKVVLTNNQSFAGVDGGYGDLRTDFTASEQIKLSIDTELGGVLVDRGSQSFTLMPISIARIEWEREVSSKVDKTPKTAA